MLEMEVIDLEDLEVLEEPVAPGNWCGDENCGNH